MFSLLGEPALVLVCVPVPDGVGLGAALAPRRPGGELEPAQLAAHHARPGEGRLARP